MSNSNIAIEHKNRTSAICECVTWTPTLKVISEPLCLCDEGCLKLSLKLNRKTASVQSIHKHDAIVEKTYYSESKIYSGKVCKLYHIDGVVSAKLPSLGLHPFANYKS